MRSIHCRIVRRNTGKLPMSLRPSAVTSSLASTVPSPGHQLTGPSARYASRWPSMTACCSAPDRSAHARPSGVGRLPLASSSTSSAIGRARPASTSYLEDLGEDPLGPAIVRRIGRGDAAARVVGQTQPAEGEGTFATANPVGALLGGVGLGDRPKLYLLDMFPYPSAYGLHVGHPLGYIGTDVYGRYSRMAGWNVLHTLGFDAFGLPAEQYAVQRGQHPRTTTESNVANYRRQLRRLGLAHDARRSIATSDPAYYRWTQWIFAQIFEAWYDVDAGRARPIAELVDELASGNRPTPDGRAWADLSGAEQQAVIDGHRLAYLADGPVNWCPGLGTVLANEEVTADGRSDIGNFPVFRRIMRQWMLRITAYADRLLDDLNALAWPQSIKTIQRNWIGRSDGARIRFPTSAGPIAVFTTRPDTVFGATFVVLAPEHPLV